MIAPLSCALLQTHNSQRDNSQRTSTFNNQQSTINNQQSTINNQQSTINNQQSTINNQQSTINNQFPKSNTATGTGRSRRDPQSANTARHIPCAGRRACRASPAPS